MQRKVNSFFVPHFVYGACQLVPLIDSFLANPTVNGGNPTLRLLRLDKRRIPLVRDSISAILFILVQSIYLKHLLRRPFISHRASSAFGDPLNDAEVLVVRVLCWTSTLMAIKTGIDGIEWGRKDSEWIGDLICVGMLAAMVLSQWSVFSNLSHDVLSQPCFKKSALKVSSLRHFGSFRASFRNRANSSHDPSDATYSLIERMLESKSSGEMFRLQSKLNLSAMSNVEKERWAYEEPLIAPLPCHSFPLRAAKRVALVVIWVVLLLALFFTLCAVIFVSCTSTYMPWIWLLCNICSSLGLEYLRFRYSAKNTVSLSPTTSGLSESVEGGPSASSRVLLRLDEDDEGEGNHSKIDAFETVNPMTEMKKAGGAGGGKMKEGREEETSNERGVTDSDL